MQHGALFCRHGTVPPTYRAPCPVVVGAGSGVTGSLSERGVIGLSVTGDIFAELMGALPPQKMANMPRTRKTTAKLPPIQIQLESASSSDDFMFRSSMLVLPSN